MEQDFYTQRLRDHGVDVVIPVEEDRTTVHDIIYQELCQGIVQETSKQKYIDIVGSMTTDRADSLIFGCTEVGLLISSDDFSIPCFDTTTLHAQAAIDFAIT